MSTLTYQRPQVLRVDRAPHAQVGSTIVQASARSPPFAGVLKPIPHMTMKPHVPAMRQDFVRHSGGNGITLPKLNTPGRNNSTHHRTDLLSPVRHPNARAGSLSTRNSALGPAAIINDAKLMQRPQIPTLPPNHALKNYTALELNRFIDKRLTDVAKSNINYSR